MDFFNGHSTYKEDWFTKDFGLRSVKKRRPVEKTLEHDLWRRSEKRADKRNIIVSKCIDEIVKEIPKNSNGYHIVYFDWDDKIYQYSFKYVRFQIGRAHV